MMMKSLLLLSLAPLAYTSAPPDQNSSQKQEQIYKCRQFKLSLAKPDGKDAHFNVSTKTLLKKFAVSKREVFIKESDLPKEQSPQQIEVEKTDEQTMSSGFVVVDKPASKRLWQKTLQWIYGNKIFVFGVHMDGEMSDENQHGKLNLSGALCSPYNQPVDQAMNDLIVAATGVAEQIADELNSDDENPVLQSTVIAGTNNPQDITAVIQPASSDQEVDTPPLENNGATPPSPDEASQDNDLSTDQQVPQIVTQMEGLDSILVPPQPLPTYPSTPPIQAPSLYDDTGISINMIAPKEIRGIRDYVAK